MDVVLVTSPVMPDVDDHVRAMQCGIEICQRAPVGGTFAEASAAQPCPTAPDSRLARRSTTLDERREENEEGKMAWNRTLKGDEIIS
jgi:hypothetical protein